MLPPGVEAYQITGPLFFGAANRLDSLLDRLYETPKVFILRMRVVPMIDASGVHALKALVERCRRKDIVLIISGLQPQPNRILVDMDLREEPGRLELSEERTVRCHLYDERFEDRQAVTTR